MQWFLNCYEGAEDLGQPHHSNFRRLFFLSAHQEGKEEGNKETQNTHERRQESCAQMKKKSSIQTVVKNCMQIKVPFNPFLQ